MDTCVATVPEASKSMELVGGQRLMLKHEQCNDIVQICSADGNVTMSILVTESGAVLRFEGAALVLQTTGSLSIEAEHLSLHGRAGASITTNGNLHVQARGDLHSAAQSQTVVATLGDVCLRANDDVKMIGERIRMNC
jgi:uncharacterized protein (DUF2345 family)